MIFETLKKEMENYAEQAHVPIIEKASLNWLCNFFLKKKITNILEIGTAIGYSSIMFCEATHANILTVEKDSIRFQQAILFLNEYEQAQRIQLVNMDALTEDFYKLAAKQMLYDVIFIDASKKNNQVFFEKFASLLQPNGYIITDNIEARGMAVEQTNLSQIPRRKRSLVKATIAFRHWLETNEMYETKFVEVGDVLAVSQKVK